jgi:hypothetical protein
MSVSVFPLQYLIISWVQPVVGVYPVQGLQNLGHKYYYRIFCNLFIIIEKYVNIEFSSGEKLFEMQDFLQRYFWEVKKRLQDVILSF